MSPNKIDSILTSYVSSLSRASQLYNNGELAINYLPMGTLIENIRSSGMGLPAFYTSIGLDTAFENGGLPSRLDKGGKSPIEFSESKKSRTFNGKRVLYEPTTLADFSFVKAYKADSLGNCIFKNTEQNTNVDVASSGKLCIVEADEIVELGSIDGDDNHLSGIFVHRVVKSPSPSVFVPCANEISIGSGKLKAKRTLILERAAKELHKKYAFLGRGLPRLIPHYQTNARIKVKFVTETGLLGMQYNGDNTNRSTSVIDGDGRLVYMSKNSAIVKCSDLFAAIRGGHMDQIYSEGYQVSELGDLASWSKGSYNGPHSNIDVVNTGSQLIVLMDHMNENGKCNLMKSCTLPLSGKKCVDLLITDMGVFKWNYNRMILHELMPGVSLEEIKAATPIELSVSKSLLKE